MSPQKMFLRGSGNDSVSGAMHRGGKQGSSAHDPPTRHAQDAELRSIRDNNAVHLEISVGQAAGSMSERRTGIPSDERDILTQSTHEDMAALRHDDGLNRELEGISKDKSRRTSDVTEAPEVTSEAPKEPEIEEVTELPAIKEPAPEEPPESVAPVPEEPVAEEEAATEPPENLPTKEKLPDKEIPPPDDKDTSLPSDPNATPSSTSSAPPKQPLATPEPVETTPPKVKQPAKNGNNAAACNTLTCKGLEIMNDHPYLYIILLAVVLLFCCLRCKCCCCRRRQQRDPRGEYRAVGRMLANNFDSELSDDDINFYDEDSGDEADAMGWSTSAKGSIELGSIGRETNGGLTLEEMNG